MSYYICWYGADGRQRLKAVGKDRRLAVELRKRKEMELNSGLVGDPAPVSFKAFVAEHEQVTEGQVAATTLVSQMDALGVLEELAAPHRLTDIDLRAVEKFVAARCKVVSPATVNKDLRTLRAIFAKAVKRGYLKENPFDGVKKLREPERSIRILSLEEIDKLLAAASSLRWKTFIYLALTTGMRLGELTHLEWEDIDLAGGMLTVQNKAEWQTKSRRIRRLSLTEQAVRMLEELRLGAKGPMVFETRDGRPLANNIQRQFQAAVRKAGIKHCTLHDLRRTFVSYLAMAGINEAIVQKLAGHASITTTLRHYTHILPESLRQAQQSLPYAHAGKPMLADSVQAPRKAPKAEGREAVSLIASSACEHERA
jgi:integrase